VTLPGWPYHLSSRQRVSPAGTWLLGSALLLLAIGVVVLYSASFYRSSIINSGDSAVFLRQQLVGVTVGVLALIVGALARPRLWVQLAPVAYVATVVLLALTLTPLGIHLNDATRWFAIGPLRFQPSEIAKLTLPLMLLWAIEKQKEQVSAGEKSIKRAAVETSLLLAIPTGLIFMQPDLGTSSFIFLLGFLLLLSWPGLASRVLGTVLVLGALTSPVWVQKLTGRWPEIQERFMAVIDPESVDQVRHSLLGIGSGGWTGKGIGMGIEKTLYLPAEFSDFIFAVFAEETGFIGVFVLIGLFLVLLASGWRVGHQSPDVGVGVLALVIVASITGQTAINMLVNTALMPTKGIPLPFLSHGSSGLVMTLFQIGVLVAIARTARVPGQEEVPA